MSDTATTSLLAELVACWESQRAPMMTAPRPAITAATIMISALVFLMVQILYKAVQACCLLFSFNAHSTGWKPAPRLLQDVMR